MGELPPKMLAWSDGDEPLGSLRDVHQRVLRDAVTGAPPTSLEVRCPQDGYMRLMVTVENRLMPYWVWRVVLLGAKVRFFARVAVLRKCPQCAFEMKVQRW